MSSMRATTRLLLLATACISASAQATDGNEWDQARARLIAGQRSSMAQAIERWKVLSGSDRFSFYDYSSFVLAYPGFPEESKLRTSAELALENESVEPSRLVAFFDRKPPVTNPARAQYALSLAALRRPEARDTAVAAWRGGAMSDGAEATIRAAYGSTFTAADHDARMNALLWAGLTPQAERQIAYVSPGARANFMARLALLQGEDPASLGLAATSDALRDTGYVYNRIRQLRRSGNTGVAVQLLAARPAAAIRPLDPTRWVSELLAVARSADARSAARIAASIDDAFEPGADISGMGFRLRDDYTSLMWLGGTGALDALGDAAAAAPLFYRYGTAARTPYTRAKGFYWAGRAMARAGNQPEANRYFEMAAAYPDNFYGLLALERLGRPVPRFAEQPTGVITPEERAAFAAKPLTAAVREVARDQDWRTTIRFFREICEQAETEGEHLLIAELAQSTGRRDLAVILGQSAHSDGFGNFHKIAFPLIPSPGGTDWTMVHAIARQESQFAQNAVSHAGARGLMQLMPGTAREQAVKMGMTYDTTALINDAGYNLSLGAGYFSRMMDYYGGSYPLAVAAYNAGPGNVNRWLRDNGDPRSGSVDWINWIERIPVMETRNYVQRVLENAVVYEAMNPEKASHSGPNPLSRFLGKRTPG